MQLIKLTPTFFKYMYDFEQAMIVTQSVWRPDKVSKRACKLSRQEFGQLIGTCIKSNDNCVIDYFGLLKKSIGFHRVANSSSDTNISTNLLYFQSIKIETLLTIDSHLMEYFPTFKKILLSIRGFPTS